MFYHSIYRLRYHIALVGSLLFFSIYSSSCLAAKHNFNYESNNNWNVEGANGQLYVFGSLTESPCQIAMESIYQSVDMGNIETANLQQVGETGKPISFNIELLDCIKNPTVLRNQKTGNVTWSSGQPGVKVRFLAESVPNYPQLITVTGIQGIGFQLSDYEKQKISLNEESSPMLLTQGQNTLTYFITPVRIASNLQAGAFRALISFELIYD